MSELPRVLCIVGPTASGKSELADLVAARLNTEIISVDSMQIYRGMDIGTAKVPLEARRVPLHMVDVADPTIDYSVALFQSQARAVADELLGGGHTPIFCGGTGLYLDAVVDEMNFPTGELGDEVRSKYERICAQEGPEAVYALLQERDSASAAEIHPNNTRRVIRALELADQGLSYAENHEGLLKREPHYDASIYAFNWPREELYHRIEQRVDIMLEQGLYKEVRELMATGALTAKTARQAIGYQEMIDVALGRCTLEEAAEGMKVRTRRFAKRQLSWLKRDGRTRWIEVDPNEPFIRTLERTADALASSWEHEARG